MDNLNTIVTIFICAFSVLAIGSHLARFIKAKIAARTKVSSAGENPGVLGEPPSAKSVLVPDFFMRYEKYIFAALLLLGIALRVIQFISVPGGLNQDEASMGYDAFATAFYGIDRNGFSFPAYAISWGSGQNVLYMYITAILVKFFGLSVFIVRLPAVIFGIASLAVFYALIKRISGVRSALLGLLLLSISPWHIMLSRWALESNLLPAVFLFAVYMFVAALSKQTKTKQTIYFCLGTLMLSLSMYAYATVTIIMPIFLLCLFVYLLVRKLITLKQTLWCAFVFLVSALPLILFYIVNIFELPSIITPLFSAPRLSAMRGTLAFDSLSHNIEALINMITKQYDGLIWNTVDGFGIMYLFMTPFLIPGLIRAFTNRRPGRNIMLFWLGCALLLGCVIHINVNRINFLFIPFIYFISEGVVFVSNGIDFLKKIKPSVVFVCMVLAISLVMFTGAYFGDDYKQNIERSFYKSFGEAVTYADGMDQPVYITTDVNGAYALVLFYTQMDPHEFVDTVIYTHNATEFRPVRSFGKYTMMVEEPLDTSGIYIVRTDSNIRFDRELFDVYGFEHYYVYCGKE